MTTTREQTQRGARKRARRQEHEQQASLDRRRADMQAAEGHAGSIPRGNQQEERENLGQHRHEWDRLLGH